MSPSSPTADVAVRPAAAIDADPIAELLLAHWLMGPSAAVTERVAQLTKVEVAQSWREAITTPPSAHHLTLVATAGPAVVGFLASAPLPSDSGPADAELLELVVSHTERRHGHGSRLLAAWADLMRDTGINGAITWVAVGDAPARDFLVGAGWGLDGSTRTLDLTGDSTELTHQVRLATSLTDQ